MLRTKLYDYLRKKMSDGELKPGTSININELIRNLNVSRTPLREALLQLQVEGFVTILPQRGVIINALKLQDVLDFYEILGALESRVILSVFDRIGPKEQSAMAQINDQMIASYTKGDLEEFYNKNIAFHDVFLQLSDNIPLVKQVELLKERLYYFPRVDYGNSWAQENIEEHNVFLSVIQSGDAKSAADYLRDVHWRFNYSKDFLAFTNEDETNVAL